MTRPATADRPETGTWPADAATWGWFLLSLAALFLLFDSSATWLGSDRGQAGLVAILPFVVFSWRRPR
jgi:hypothetical protein